MVNVPQAAFGLIALVMAVPGAQAATCSRRPAIAVQVDVHEAPIIAHDNLSLSELQRMAAQAKRPPAHPVLGFYTGTIGYTLQRADVLNEASPTLDAEPCPRLDIQAGLVAIDRRIAVARDLSAAPCRLRAATEHYRRHAAAASLALHRFAAELPRTLESEMERYVLSHPGLSQAQQPDVRQHVESLLDRAVKMLSASLAEIQAGVDTPSEVRSLSTACGET